MWHYKQPIKLNPLNYAVNQVRDILIILLVSYICNYVDKVIYFAVLQMQHQPFQLIALKLLKIKKICCRTYALYGIARFHLNVVQLLSFERLGLINDL